MKKLLLITLAGLSLAGCYPHTEHSWKKPPSPHREAIYCLIPEGCDIGGQHVPAGEIVGYK